MSAGRVRRPEPPRLAQAGPRRSAYLLQGPDRIAWEQRLTAGWAAAAHTGLHCPRTSAGRRRRWMHQVDPSTGEGHPADQETRAHRRRSIAHEAGHWNPNDPHPRRQPLARPPALDYGTALGHRGPAHPISRAASSGPLKKQIRLPDGSIPRFGQGVGARSGRCRRHVGCRKSAPAPKKTLSCQTPSYARSRTFFKRGLRPPHLPSSDDPPPTSPERIAHPPN